MVLGTGLWELGEENGDDGTPKGVVCLYAANRWENVVVLDASFDRMATLASQGGEGV